MDCGSIHKQGFEAALQGMPLVKNPFTRNTPSYHLWCLGWYDALCFEQGSPVCA